MKLDAAFIAQLGDSPAPNKHLMQAKGVSFHSGRVKKGDAFFALAGEASHGIKFADDALAKGAAFIVSDKPHPKGIVVNDPAQTLLKLGKWARAELTCPIIAITGSAKLPGLATTKSITASI